MSTSAHAVLLSRLALAGAALVMVIIATSAYLRLSAAGLGCLDWPACYGLVAEDGTVAYPVLIVRAVHRLSAMAVGIVTITIAVLCLSQRIGTRPRTAAAIGMLLLALTVFLAVLGRWTAGTRVPLVTVGNLLGGMGMLGLLTWLHAATQFHPGVGDGGAILTRRLLVMGLVLMLAEIALGGLLSASFSAFSCSGFPLCEQVWRGGLADALGEFGRPLRTGSDGRSIAAAAAVALHELHRGCAVAIAAVLAWAAVRMWRQGGPLRQVALGLASALALQLALGAIMVLGELSLAAAVLHNAAAAVLLCTAVRARVALAR